MWLWLTMAMAYGSVLSYDAPRAVELGKPAVLTLQPHESGTVKADVRCGEKQWSNQLSMIAGTPIPVALSGLPEGVFQCEVALEVALPDGRAGALNFSFPLAHLPLVAWTVDVSQVDTAAKRATPTTSRPLTEATMVIIGERGAILQTVAADLSNPTAPVFQWTAPGEALKLEIEGRDAHGFITTLTLQPWQYAIPHEDVVFASGKHEITAEERPKLEACWAEVTKVLARYGDIVQIELFVAGYTDTVGAKDGNQALSERRAKAIAAWFRARGFDRPIYYQGFGEDALAVPTPDETDQVANRRALYVLASAPPKDATNLPRASWRPL